MKRWTFIVDLETPDEATELDVRAYIMDAVGNMKGCYRPPGGFDVDDPGDPMWDSKLLNVRNSARVKAAKWARAATLGALAGVLGACAAPGSANAPPVHLGATASHSPLLGQPTRFPGPVSDDGTGSVAEDARGVYDGTLDFPMYPTSYRAPYPVYDATVGDFPAPIKTQERCISTFNTWSKQVVTRCR